MFAVIKAAPGLEFGAPALKRFKRRRANAHSPYSRFRRPRICNVSAGALDTLTDAPEEKTSLPLASASADDDTADAARRYQQGTNRRMRRNKPELAFIHSLQHKSKAELVCGAADRPESSLAKQRWLAKRFVMASSSEAVVPVHAHGKGKRRQCLFRAVRGGAVLRDISHWPVTRLCGAPPALTNFLLKHLHISHSQDVHPCKDLPQQTLNQQTLIKCCRSGGYIIECWLVDSRANLLGPCIAEFHIPEAANSSKEAGQAHATSPLPEPIPALEDSQPGIVTAEGCNDPSSITKPTPPDLWASTAAVSLTVHPQAVAELKQLLKHGRITTSATGMLNKPNSAPHTVIQCVTKQSNGPCLP